MGGVIGATTGKFVLIAATLVLQGRVDNARMPIAIAPGIMVSMMGAALAEQVAQSGNVKIGIRAEYFYATINRVAPNGAALTIGRDILDANPIEIDFRHHRVRPLLISEAGRAERGMTAVPVNRRLDGSLHTVIAINGRPSIDATIDLASAAGVTMPAPTGVHDVHAGSATLHDVELTTGEIPVIGLLAFRHERVVFDLGHDRIWIGV